MRKLYLAIIILAILVFSFFTGIYLSKMNQVEKMASSENSQNGNNQNTALSKQYDINILESQKTNSEDKKISPNATLVLKTYYQECGHTIKEYKEITNDMINLTKEELLGQIQDWEIEKFDSKEIILKRTKEGECGQHYIIREKEGFIAVYNKQSDGTEKLEELTHISIQYLTQTDLKEIQKGISANGMEELNSRLEDFE